MSKKIKIFPRNLTAKAEENIKGNPMSSRLESGVDNCYPGLEFDQRNLDKSFFPGLRFEFHRSNGAKLIEVIENSSPNSIGLTQEDVNNNEIYLWVLAGYFGSSPINENQELSTTGLNGLEVWRRVHDLNMGKVAILLGSGDGFSNLASSQYLNLMRQYFESGQQGIQRDSENNFQVAIFVGEREEYLDEDGVINTEVYNPGELTKTLCSPWQHDFRDCGCFYWAANKPDIVTSSDGSENMLNFMRKDREASQPENPLEQWNRNLEYNYHDLANGDWNNIPVIINDRESESFNPNQPVINEVMTKEEVISELKYLASVEHALCIEYLYAHYSINAPQKLEDNSSDEIKNKYIAAKEILSIAIDEMRHLRWVNEALNIFQEEPVVDRAKIIHKTLNKPFELKPLTKEQLQWFIDIEKPSQDLGQSVDGMYVKILLSIEKQPDLFSNSERLIHLFKLIIDEGEDHHQRFLSIQKHLSGFDEEQYLRPLSDPSTDSRLKALQKLADQNYEVMLGTLSIAFSYSDGSNGQLLEEARRAMYNLHDTAHLLGLNGTDINFTLPSAELIAMKDRSAIDNFSAMSEKFNKTVEDIKPLIKESEVEMLLKQQTINNTIFSKMKTVIQDLN